MSNYKIKTGVSEVAKILTYLLVVIMITAIIAGLISYLSAPKGMYLNYGDTVVKENTDVAIMADGSDNVFKVANTEGFGSYTVADCIVKVVPNVDEQHDFEFTIDGDETVYKFSSEKDLTSAFCEDYSGDGIKIASDGTFVLSTEKVSMIEILQTVYKDKKVILDQDIKDVEFGQYPYFALAVTSPDGKQNLKIPFRYYYDVVGVELDKEVIVF